MEQDTTNEQNRKDTTNDTENVRPIRWHRDGAEAMRRVSHSNIGGGNGLGQYTGADALANGREAKELICMIASVENAGVTIKRVCGDLAFEFVNAQLERYNTIVTHFTVSGKQLFWLRDIKDKLVDAGVL